MVRLKGRPTKKREVIINSKVSEFVECIGCFHVFDLNANYRNLQQAIIDDKQFCPTCFREHIMEKEYEDQNDIIQQYYGSFGLRRK
jgi:hypothetical protein